MNVNNSATKAVDPANFQLILSFGEIHRKQFDRV